MTSNQVRGKTNKSSEEQEEEEEKPLEDFRLLPPLLDAKFGNGMLLQFCLNQPGPGPESDDNWNLLEIGFAIGISCLVMRVHHTAWIYILKSFGPLVNYNKRKLRMAKVVARYINNVGAVLQALLLLGTCIYCVAISGMVNHEDKESKYYVKKRVYLFTTTISSIMTVCLVEAIICWTLTLTTWQLTETSPPVTDPNLPHPATSLINLGLANAFLGIYVGSEDQGFGSQNLLLDLGLASAAITIFMNTTETILQISIHFAKVNCPLFDNREVIILRSLHLIRYSMAVGQAIVFSLMLGSSIYVFIIMEDMDPEHHIPRNILYLSTIVSSLVIGSVLYVILSIIVLKWGQE